MDRRILAKVDRRLLSELDHTEGTQLVKVPVSDAVWSTWRRYCEAVGVSMGRGLAVLLHRELASVVEVDLEGLALTLADREASALTRETELRDRERVLVDREREVAVLEYRLAETIRRLEADPTWQPPKRGRNDQCWCWSGKKFKTCHGKVS
ncbi:MAG: hypothetical protein HKO70_15380 [Acidimicrobiia bacterium]|nr:hypothetical protein [Acidimicrobiia bacterium]